MRESDTLTLPDKRILAYAIYGSPVPHTSVFYFHSHPSSRKEGKIWHTAAARLGVRLVVPDRPGIGNSTFQPNRTLLDWPKDVLALADHLKIQTFYVIGFGGGGPYTLACVKGVMKERLAGAAVVSGFYSTSLGTAGVPTDTRLMLWISSWAPGVAGALTDMSWGRLARDSDSNVFEAALLKDIEDWPEIDKRAIKSDKNREGFVEGRRESFAQGGKGVGWEAKLQGSAWDFELHDLKIGNKGVPLTIWHGLEDTNCPATLTLKAKEMMPAAEIRMRDGEGHLSFALRNQEEILKELIGYSEIGDLQVGI